MHVNDIVFFRSQMRCIVKAGFKIRPDTYMPLTHKGVFLKTTLNGQQIQVLRFLFPSAAQIRAGDLREIDSKPFVHSLRNFSTHSLASKGKKSKF